MAHFDDIYDIAADGYGIITAKQAQEAGATPSELNRRCAECGAEIARLCD